MKNKKNEKKTCIIKVDSSIERFMPDFTRTPKVTKHLGRRSPGGQEGPVPSPPPPTPPAHNFLTTDVFYY